MVCMCSPQRQILYKMLNDRPSYVLAAVVHLNITTITNYYPNTIRIIKGTVEKGKCLNVWNVGVPI